jgi:peptidoglycan/LPS O-acetylase OafA/YrhL
MAELPGAASPEAPANPVAPAATLSARGHIPVLDGVRGLAVLAVLLFHFVGFLEPTNAIERVIAKVAPTGAFGVELFFVLSGFLITGILVDARFKPNYFRNFFMRRLLRIFPLYYGVLALIFFVAPSIPWLRGPDLDFLRERQAWAWLYGVNVYLAIQGEWAFGAINHFWSLCVEEHFYFVWPLVVWALAPNPRRLMWVSLSLSLGAMAARFLGNLAGMSWWSTYVLLPFRLDGLALGGFLAVLFRLPGGVEDIRRHLPRVAAVAAFLVAVTLGWVKVSRWGLTFVYVFRVSLFLVLLACLAMWGVVAPERSWISRFFRARAMVFLGTYSYGLYVYHHFISHYMVHHRTYEPLVPWLGNLGAVLVQAVVGIGLSTALAWASYNFYEKRFLSLKRFFEPAR